MKERNDKLTLRETEQLCRLYMDCELTVLEETELQYVLGKLPYSSPCIDEVRLMMGITLAPNATKTTKKSFRFFRSGTAISVAASFAILSGVGIFMIIKSSGTPESSPSAVDNHVYIEAYHHGRRLKGEEAIAATYSALAKADSLMNYASLTERENLMKANTIISATTNN